MEQNDKIANYTKILRQKKNIILQGAPGTGKTYNTAALALSICGVDISQFKEHKELMEEYNKLCYDQKENPNGQIGFVTFHQSMDYEDFVEGIKPKIAQNEKGENIGISYNVEDGIFKLMCKNAEWNYKPKDLMINDFEKLVGKNPKIWQLKLGEYGRTDIKEDCFSHDYIRCGWDEDWEKTPENFEEGHKKFRNEMNKGDVVLIFESKKDAVICGIAVITSDYQEFPESDKKYRRYRKVKWLSKNISKPIKELNEKDFSIATIYELEKLNIEKIKHLISTDDSDTQENINNPHVLIIDEINRGNVSKIFGELITLLEADKRLGGDHPISVTLPYSKVPFSVPSNLYIIGTMNTTDRSVGNIDYAVRRRFAFVTLEADRNILIEKYGEESLNVKLFDAVKTFLDDKDNKSEMDIDDLMVGHSYFMADDENELRLKLEYEIIPLLSEYYKDGIITKAVPKISDTSDEDADFIRYNLV